MRDSNPTLFSSHLVDTECKRKKCLSDSTKEQNNPHTISFLVSNLFYAREMFFFFFCALLSHWIWGVADSRKIAKIRIHQNVSAPATNASLNIILRKRGDSNAPNGRKTLALLVSLSFPFPTGGRRANRRWNFPEWKSSRLMMQMNLEGQTPRRLPNANMN